MEANWRQTFQRLFEIFSESDQDNTSNYFQNFEDDLRSPLAQTAYERLEGELQQLDKCAWQQLKQKALGSVTVKDGLHRYSQLFDCLNEAKGYIYLKSEGYKQIQFIPRREEIQTPELVGCCGKHKVLLEVKTLNQSEKETKLINSNSQPGNSKQLILSQPGLSDEFKRKIMDKVLQANSQLMSYADDEVHRRIVFLIINLDISLAADAKNIDEIRDYVRQQSDNHIEVVSVIQSHLL